MKRSGENLSELPARCSLGQSPVIDDGETILAVSNAILNDLAAKYGDGRWLSASRYLAEDEPTIADVPACSSVSYIVDMPALKNEPCLIRTWLSAIGSLPHVVKLHPSKSSYTHGCAPSY
ncbi:hypothetical protein L4G45_01960 [Pseudomonas sp. P2498]|uniref:GST N-terminal domain-containing protein n=2 Tax=Pseudomonas petrae TaxID=2912190 RepID=A0ABS9I940_9PSED|nr:hypothetical protein [Pseudomonas petrae]MCF7536654.1 hypothetical protein [Pseudomonas petrae]MCF7544265.1 hypothetical protein [Pseudomonas petrae]MCF7554334.1 hypothetical protein [Pseudomonas petrae]